jgi:hypothetical protein
MKVLQQDLIKYSKQIGIIECEIPKLVFYGEQFRSEVHETYRRCGFNTNRPGRKRGGRNTKYFGLYSPLNRLIFVNIRGRRTLRELRIILVHELVHYRFNYLSHKAMESRIKLILRGKEYPRKHITVPQLPYI